MLAMLMTATPTSSRLEPHILSDTPSWRRLRPVLSDFFADDMDMPPRMREAMERRKGKQPAPAASDCCDAPAAPTKKVVPAHDPKSVSARLAKIEKGKGPSAQNPLLGLGQSEKSGSSSVCRRKGGG